MLLFSGRGLSEERQEFPDKKLKCDDAMTVMKRRIATVGRPQNSAGTAIFVCQCRDIAAKEEAFGPENEAIVEGTRVASVCLMSPAVRLMDQVRIAMRSLHYSRRTEESYVGWIRRFILFHGKRHPADMGEPEIKKFLDFLAVQRQVAASTQNQALAAVLFLYHHVLLKEIGFLQPVHAKRPERLPVVLTREEVRIVLAQTAGVPRLVATLLYGGGLRLEEGVSLRVKDLDFGYLQVTVRDGKGHKDRVTMLPASLKEELAAHLARVRVLHQKDLADGAGRVWLPDALAVKYPNADREMGMAVRFPGVAQILRCGGPYRASPPYSRVCDPESHQSCSGPDRNRKVCDTAHLSPQLCDSPP